MAAEICSGTKDVGIPQVGCHHIHHITFIPGNGVCITYQVMVYAFLKYIPGGRAHPPPSCQNVKCKDIPPAGGPTNCLKRSPKGEDGPGSSQ